MRENTSPLIWNSDLMNNKESSLRKNVKLQVDSRPIKNKFFTATEKLWLKRPLRLSCLVADRHTGEQLGQTPWWRLSQTFSPTPAKVHIISQSKNILKLMRNYNGWVTKHNSQAYSRLCSSIHSDLRVTHTWLNLQYQTKRPVSLKKKFSCVQGRGLLMQHDRRHGGNTPRQEEEEEKSVSARRHKPAYSLYAQFNPAYLGGLRISPMQPDPPHIYTHIRLHNTPHARAYTHTKKNIMFLFKQNTRTPKQILSPSFLRLAALGRGE